MEWRISQDAVPYPQALEAMKERVEDVQSHKASELVWLLEHPPLYTTGSRGAPNDLLDPQRFPVFQSGRGGQYTYHGPGQRIVYLVLDLNRRVRDVRQYISALEEWVCRTLAEFGVIGQTYPDRVGIWVENRKIAAIGVRLQRWVTSHGLAININPDLAHYQGIVPCGLPEYGVTSLHDLGIQVDQATVDDVLRQQITRISFLNACQEQKHP